MTTYIDDGQLLASAGAYQVTMHRDESAIFPDGDGYAPQYMMPWSWKQADDLALNMDRDMQAWLYSVVKHFQNYLHDSDLAFDTLERYARIFHSVNARVYSTTGYCQGDHADIIVWPSDEWLELVGLDTSYTPTEEDIQDFNAYLWGDVYYLKVSESVEWMRTGSDEVKIELEYVDALHGLYAADGALQSYHIETALELLSAHTSETPALASDELSKMMKNE